MRITINNIGDLIRELQKYPPYALIFTEDGKPIEEIKYDGKIPFYDLSKDKWDKKEGFKIE